MTKTELEQKVEAIKNEAELYTSMRLARGSVLMQREGHVLPQEWEDRRRTQSERVAFINEKLK